MASTTKTTPYASSRETLQDSAQNNGQLQEKSIDDEPTPGTGAVDTDVSRKIGDAEAAVEEGPVASGGRDMSKPKASTTALPDNNTY
jgi:hypothetical protein